MLLAALLCGLVTAYYFGLKAGAYAAAITAGLFVVAFIAPPFASWAYAFIAAGLIGVCFAGPRWGKPMGKRRAVLAVREVVTKLSRLRRG